MRRFQRIRRLVPQPEPDGEDRISALPDCIVEQILSSLPSTKQAVQTGILSRRWRHLWTRVPLLLFNSTGKSDQNFSQFIDQTLILHDCPEIKKFQIKFDSQLGSDPQIVPKLRLAARKQAEELILHLPPPDERDSEVPKNLWLPEFLFNNLSLVKLELFKCCFSENQRANWPNLKELRLDCSYLEYLRLDYILDGCPLLEFLEITYSGCRGEPVIASKSLKKLSFVNSTGYNLDNGYVEILCPNLEELCVKLSQPKVYSLCSVSDRTIDHVLSNSPFLHMLEISGFICSRRLVFASMSFKKLDLGGIHMFSGLKILCPCLEEFRWCPSILPSDEVTIDKKTSAVKILRQLRHVKLLDIGGWLIETLKVKDSSSLLLNCECLTFDGTDFDRCLPGIVTAISCSPLLEKLVIMFRPNKSENTVATRGLTDCRKKNNSNSDGVLLNCSVSNLKTVEIIGLSERDDSCKLVFNFVEFLLKNGRVLENMVFVSGKCSKRFIFDVSKKLLSLPRYSPNTNIEIF